MYKRQRQPQFYLDCEETGEPELIWVASKSGSMNACRNDGGICLLYTSLLDGRTGYVRDVALEPVRFEMTAVFSQREGLAFDCLLYTSRCV